MKRCHKCGEPWVSSKRQPAVKECCEACAAYLHCCFNCRHRNPSLHNQCAIPTTDWVGNRTGANFCDEFEFAETAADKQEANAHEVAQQAFDGLFGDGDTRDGRRMTLDSLFGTENTGETHGPDTGLEAPPEDSKKSG